MHDNEVLVLDEEKFVDVVKEREEFFLKHDCSPEDWIEMWHAGSFLRSGENYRTLHNASFLRHCDDSATATENN